MFGIVITTKRRIQNLKLEAEVAKTASRVAGIKLQEKEKQLKEMNTDIIRSVCPH